MLFTPKVVHNHQGGALHMKAGYMIFPPSFPLLMNFACAVSFVFVLFPKVGLFDL